MVIIKSDSPGHIYGRKGEKMKKKSSAISLIMLVAILLSGCADTAPKDTDTSDTSKVTSAQTDELTTKTEETDTPKQDIKYYTNPLTGELTSLYDNLTKRPAAVVLKNDRTGAPQVGIAQADIIYEAAVEGGMTRLLALYSDYAHTSDIGPVIDSRAYFFDFAMAHDAIFVQAGSSSYGKTAQKEDGIDCIDAIIGEMSPTFRRDETLVDERGHSSSIVAVGSSVFNKVKQSEIRTENNVKTSLTMKFSKNYSDYLLDGDVCVKLTVPYSSAMNPHFEYSTLTNSYTRYQYGDVHKDNDGTALRFTNILVLFAEHSIVNSTSGEMDILTTGAGSGYYICGGKYIPISWERESADVPFRYFLTNGKELEMCRGKTFVCVTSEKRKNDVTFG